MVQTRRRNSRRSTRNKEGKGCFCCSEKTKCSSISNQKHNDIENEQFVNQKDSYTTKVTGTKKHSGRKSPISSGLSSVLRQRRDSNLDSRTPQDCVVLISDWLRQQDVSSVAMDESSSDTPSTSSPASSQPQEQEDFLLQELGAASPDAIMRPPSVSSSDVMRPPSVSSPDAMRPPSVSSSWSAPLSPDSPSPSVFSQGGSSSGQDDQSEVATTSSGKSGKVRTPQRREKQRIASAKSRRKKKGEGHELLEKAEQLEKDNEFLQRKIASLEIERERYLSGEYKYDDSHIIDPYDTDDSDQDEGASPGGAAGALAT